MRHANDDKYIIKRGADARVADMLNDNRRLNAEAACLKKESRIDVQGLKADRDAVSRAAEHRHVEADKHRQEAAEYAQ